jgi:hypothetical protein
MRWWLVCALFFGCDDLPAAPAGPDMAQPKCDDTNAGVCPARVTGQVANDNGMAVDALTTSLCADQCFFGMTGSDGKFTIVADQHIVLANYAVEVHGRPTYTTYYTPLPAANGLDITFSLPLLVGRLPDSGPELMAGTPATSNGVTVDIPAGTEVVFNVEDFGAPNGHQLRVLPISDLAAGLYPFVGDPRPDALYACSPFEVSFGQKASLSFVNSAQIPAGTAVEIKSLRGLVNGAPPAGGWQHAALAHVSADGRDIVTDPGEGVTELTWLWLRRM